MGTPLFVPSVPLAMSCTFCTNVPIFLFLVKHTAGRNLVPEKSSNGKGTKTTLPLVIKWPPVLSCVNILFGFLQEIEGWICACNPKPFLFIYLSIFG